MIAESGEPLAGLLAGFPRTAVHFDVRGDEGAHQPWPHGSLVIRRIAAHHATFEPRPVLRIARREAPEAHRRQQLARDHRDNLLRAVIAEHGVWQANRE